MKLNLNSCLIKHIFWPDTNGTSHLKLYWQVQDVIHDFVKGPPSAAERPAHGQLDGSPPKCSVGRPSVQSGHSRYSFLTTSVEVDTSHHDSQWLIFTPHCVLLSITFAINIYWSLGKYLKCVLAPRVLGYMLLCFVCTGSQSTLILPWTINQHQVRIL